MTDDSRIALVTREESLTFSELEELANSLVECVPERSVVFLVATNTVAAVAAYIGLLKRHAVVIMIRKETTPGQFSGLVDAYEPQFIWAPDGFCFEEPCTAAEVFCDRGYRMLRTGFDSYEVNPETALLLTTSGSTGTPKFVRLSYGNIEANARSIAKYQGITSVDRAITTLPFSYSYGISIVNSHLISGASLALTDESIMSRSFWNFLRDVRATNFGGVPYTYSMLERLRFNSMDLPSLRFISQAGGRLGERLQGLFAEWCSQKEIDLFVMYGQTEATARMSWLPPRDALKKLGSIGVAIPGGSFELRDVDGVAIEGSHISGELVYRGPNVSLGYATCKDDLALGDMNNGVLHTGDIAERDDEGYFYIVGRMKRFLKLFGNRVNMDEIEALLAKRGIEAACVGVDDKMTVFMTSGDEGEVRRTLSAETGINIQAFEARRVDGIPHINSGKIDYVKLEGLC